MRFIVGVDLGKMQDPTAVSIVERFPRGHDGKTLYHLRHLQQIPLGTLYTTVVNDVGLLLGTAPLRGEATLVLDGTGVGVAVCDIFAQAGMPYIGVVITGGASVSHEGNVYKVPKRDLIGTLQVLLQGGRLQIAEELPGATTLVNELLSFRYQISAATGNDTYAPWRESAHDDTVLATAIACWYGEYIGASVPLSAVQQPMQRSRFAGTVRGDGQSRWGDGDGGSRWR